MSPTVTFPQFLNQRPAYKPPRNLSLDIHIANSSPRPISRSQPTTPYRRASVQQPLYYTPYTPYTPYYPAPPVLKSPRAFAVPVRYYETVSKQCGFHCGNPRMPGSAYCKHDTCRNEHCVEPSRTWDGYCEHHGCASRKCIHKRAVTKLVYEGEEAARIGSERHGTKPDVVEKYHVSMFCKVHMCRVWGCKKEGKKELTGYCGEHFEDLYDYY